MSWNLRLFARDSRHANHHSRHGIPCIENKRSNQRSMAWRPTLGPFLSRWAEIHCWGLVSIQRGICMDKHTCMYIYIYWIYTVYIYTEYIYSVYIYIHSYLSYLSVSIYLPTVSRSDQMIISTWSIVHCILSPRAATHQAWHNMPISTLQSPLRRNDLGGSKSWVMGTWPQWLRLDAFLTHVHYGRVGRTWELLTDFKSLKCFPHFSMSHL